MDQTIKADAGKPQLHLVPTQIIRDVAEVREYGIGKYGDTDSWRRVELVRYVDAMYRHMLAFIDDPYGCDAESGIPHYKHMACNMAFICELMKVLMGGSNHKADNPVKHGRWERILSPRGETAAYMCEECTVFASAAWPYCPHCGRKMDMEGNRETD